MAFGKYLLLIMTLQYKNVIRFLVAVDCIVFGFDGQHLKLLLVKRAIEPEKGKWSLMGGFIQQGESAEEAANRVLWNLTGLNGVYLNQLHTFSQPLRDPLEHTFSIAFSALIDINQYKTQLNEDYHAEWFLLNQIPNLIFDHNEMVLTARKKIRYQAAHHPILFELLPRQFTIPHIQTLFEQVFETKFDKGNFSRKLVATGMLIKLSHKDKLGSKKGAFFYKLNKQAYLENFHKVQRLVPKPNISL